MTLIRLLGFAALLGIAAAGCGSGNDSPSTTDHVGTAARTAPARTITVKTPTNTTPDATLIALARLAERELRGIGGYARWQVQEIRAGSANDLVILTRLDPGPAAQRAATGICTSLFNPSVTAINVDKVTVIASNGREIPSSACKAQ
jgi:hypothetical protein